MRRSRALATMLLGAALAACSGTTSPTSTPVSECVPVTAKEPTGATLDLTGEWSANDGGRYRLKQIDSCLVWVGLSHFEEQSVGDSWITTFRGQIAADRTITGEFLDVSGTNPGSGTLTLRVEDNKDAYLGIVITATGHTGSPYGGSFWERVRPAEPDESPSGEIPTDETPTAETPTAGTPTEGGSTGDIPADGSPSATPSSPGG